MSIEIVSNQEASKSVQPVNAGADKELSEKETKESAEAKIASETTEESDASENLEDSEKADTHEEEKSEVDEDDSQGDEKPKKKHGVQKRIEKLLKKNTEKDQTISAKDREIEYLRQQLLGKSSETPEQKTDVQKNAPSDGRPVAPRMADFETHEAYETARDEFQEKLADWKYEQREKVKQAHSEVEKVSQTYQSKLQEFKKEHADFDEVVMDFKDSGASEKFTQALNFMIESSDHGPAVLYELMKDTKEFERINSLAARSPLAAAKEIGKIEFRLSKESESPKVEPKVTKAPKPIPPVGAKGSGGTHKTLFDVAKSGTQAEYEAMRREMMRKKA